MSMSDPLNPLAYTIFVIVDHFLFGTDKVVRSIKLLDGIVKA